MKNKIPPYSFFRILIVSMILYFLLITPTTTYMVVKNFPMFFGKGPGSLIKKETTATPNNPDSLYTTIPVGAQSHDINISNNGNRSVAMDFNKKSAGISAAILNLISLILMGVVIGFNVPFKKYLKRKRKNLEISPKLAAYCRKNLFRMPWYNSGALLVALLIRNLDSVFRHSESVTKTEHELGANMLIISIISSLLMALFTFFWQQHSIHFRNLEYFFDKEELYKRQKNSFGIRMRGKFLLVQGITTLLPVAIIVFYIFMSMSKPADFGINKVSEEQAKILFGGYSSLLHDVINDETTLNDIASGSYINTIDMFLSGIGILAGVIVTLIYIMFFVRWLTIQTTSPIKNLLAKMEEATETKTYSLSLVRTRDELGQLTEGYNVMAEKIMNYISEVEEINRGLEAKVKERTAEIEAQRDEIEAQRDEIEAQRDVVVYQKGELEKHHVALKDSIRYAEKIQMTMIPSLQILQKGVSEHFVFFQPRDIVSGDFYWASEVAGKLVIAVVDCTGHGVPGAFMSMLGITFLNEIVKKEIQTDPQLVMEQLRKNVIAALGQQQAGSDCLQFNTVKDGMDMVLLVYDKKNMKITFSGAYNPVWLVRSGKEKPEITEFHTDKMPVAIHERMLPFSSHETSVSPGDCLYLMTDGFKDQFGGPDDRKFKVKRMRELILSVSGLPMQEQQKKIKEHFYAWKGKSDQIDDITLMGIRI